MYEGLWEVICDCLRRDMEVHITGFGTFIPRIRNLDNNKMSNTKKNYSGKRRVVTFRSAAPLSEYLNS